MTALVLALTPDGYDGRADRLIIAVSLVALAAWVVVMAWRDSRGGRGPWEPLP